MNKFLKVSLLVLIAAASIAYLKPELLERSKLLELCSKVPGLNLLLADSNSHVDTLTAEERIFTREELAQYKGENGGPIYIAIMGKVFDVSRAPEYYGPGGGYAFFSGVDGSRAFVTGEFTEEGLVDDISGLDSSNYLSLKEWSEFYEKDYKYIGKLQGKYYGEGGRPTAYWHMVQRWISAAVAEKADEDVFKEKYPQCNVEYKPETGSRVWCSKASGGIHRDWVGFPRSLYFVDSNKIRCACVRPEDLNDPLLKPYPNCPPDSESCKLSD